MLTQISPDTFWLYDFRHFYFSEVKQKYNQKVCELTLLIIPLSQWSYQHKIGRFNPRAFKQWLGRDDTVICAADVMWNITYAKVGINVNNQLTAFYW